MDYSRLSIPARRQRSGPPPFGVGERAVVQYERARMAGMDVVLLTDESGGTTLRALPDGQEVEIEADGLVARCIQHELDHLDGVLIIDRFSPAKKQAIKARLRELEERFGDSDRAA